MDHYFSPEPKSELVLFRLKIQLLGHDIELYNSSGVFSTKDLDKGTELLIRKAIIRPGCEVLDLGCGNGAVGIMMALAYNAKVTMSDINERAVFIARKNVHVKNLAIKVIKSDGYQKIDSKFDSVLLNPPQTAGRKVCEMLIRDTKEHLNPGGSLQVVARHNKGGKTLSLYMAEIFGNVRDIAKKGGYRVYVSDLATEQ